MTFVAVPEIQEILRLMKDLQAQVISLEQTRVPPTLPAPPAAERKDIQQWTVRLSKALFEHLKAVAYERRIHPSQLVEDLVWHALTDRRSSTPEWEGAMTTTRWILSLIALLIPGCAAPVTYDHPSKPSAMPASPRRWCTCPSMKRKSMPRSSRLDGVIGSSVASWR